MSQKPEMWKRKCICSTMQWDYRKQDFKWLHCFFSKWENWLHLFFPFLQLIICIYVPINIASHSHPQILLRNWFLAEYDFLFATWIWAWQSSTFICPLFLSWQFLLWVQELLQVNLAFQCCLSHTAQLIKCPKSLSTKSRQFFLEDLPLCSQSS